MSEQDTHEAIGEQLSVLMDGELPRDQLRFLLRRIDADAELSQRWSRYQLVRSSLRRHPMLPLRVDFAEVLMQRIAHESVPVARRRGAALLRWAGGGAIAAAVAVVALVTTRPQVENAQPASSVAAANTAVPAPQDTRPAQAPVPAPALVNFDYAQPASFDTGAGLYSGAVAIPRYDVRRRYDANGFNLNGSGSANEFAPYVLLTAPRPQQAVPNNVETPQP
jgi:sigma-E factor negative regulatory protein RseA